MPKDVKKYYIGDIVYPRECELDYVEDYKQAKRIYGVIVQVDKDHTRQYAVAWCDSKTREEIEDLDLDLSYAWLDSEDFVSQQEYLEMLKEQYKTLKEEEEE